MTDGNDLREKQNLSREQVRQDLELLLYALKFGYGGRKYVPRGTFASALSELSLIEKKIKTPATSRQLLEACDQALLKLPDNHLVMRSPTTGLSKLRQQKTRSGSVGKNLNQNPETPWALNFRSVGARRIPVLSLSSFPAAEDDSWNRFKEDVGSVMSSPFLIIDLRGNTGGSDVMGAWLASRLLGRKVDSPYAAIHSSTTRETLALSANNWKLKTLFNKLQKTPVPAYFETRLEEKVREYHTSSSSLTGEEERQIAYEFEIQNSEPYRGQVILLFDAECASSCESVVEFFEQVPRSLTLGENTAGSVHFANAGVLLLPNSQLMVQIPSDFWSYKDGRFIEKVGYPPKVRVFGDALEKALEIIKANP
jgi:C-terminal processing protease CtpA/Prc